MSKEHSAVTEDEASRRINHVGRAQQAVEQAFQDASLRGGSPIHWLSTYRIHVLRVWVSHVAHERGIEEFRAPSKVELAAWLVDQLRSEPVRRED